MIIMSVLALIFITLPTHATSDYYASLIAHASEAQSLGHFEQATELLIQACDADDDAIQAREQLVALYKDRQKFALAYDEQIKLVKKRPHNPAYIYELGILLSMQGEYERALTIYSSLMPHVAANQGIYYNYAYCLKNLGRFADAIPYYEKAAALGNPEDEDLTRTALFGCSMCRLALGDFEKGLPGWESRLAKKYQTIQTYDFSGSLAGKHIFIMSELGLGDNLQFIRYAQLLKKRGATIIYKTFPRMKKLFSLCPYLDTVIGHNESTPMPIDMVIILASLPLAFHTRVETIYSPDAYLYADPQLEAEWKECVAHDHAFKVGINWHGCGDERNPVSYGKNIPLTLMLQLARIEGVHLYSLQKEGGCEEIATVHHPQFTAFETLDTQHGTFMDTAALMKNMDLVITIDTSVAHLAGGLGVPVWVALPHVADWRWLQERSDTPWYPSMRLFRQPQRNDWQSVINTMCEELKKLVATHHASGRKD